MLSIVCGFTESIPRRKHEAFTLYIAGMIRLHAPMNLFNSNLRLGGGTVLQGTLILMWVVLFSLSTAIIRARDKLDANVWSNFGTVTSQVDIKRTRGDVIAVSHDAVNPPHNVVAIC